MNHLLRLPQKDTITALNSGLREVFFNQINIIFEGLDFGASDSEQDLLTGIACSIQILISAVCYSTPISCYIDYTILKFY